METSDIISLGGVIVGVAGTIFGLWQHRDARKWRQADRFEAFIREFQENPSVRQVRQMLDYYETLISFEEEQKPARVSDSLVIEALTPHSRKENFTNQEAQIRTAFDDYCAELERLNSEIRAGRVTVDQCRPHLEYWLRILGDPESGRKPRDFALAVWSFLRAYDYSDAEELLERFGFKSPVTREPIGESTPQAPDQPRA